MKIDLNHVDSRVISSFITTKINKVRAEMNCSWREIFVIYFITNFGSESAMQSVAFDACLFVCSTIWTEKSAKYIGALMHIKAKLEYSLQWLPAQDEPVSQQFPTLYHWLLKKSLLQTEIFVAFSYFHFLHLILLSISLWYALHYETVRSSISSSQTQFNFMHINFC